MHVMEKQQVDLINPCLALKNCAILYLHSEMEI
uniref:Uncharacterized protein n=1 Tax=Anguilla anguilla TaxID=7936 RepID=A0A0E9T903_ANGAN